MNTMMNHVQFGTVKGHYSLDRAEMLAQLKTTLNTLNGTSWSAKVYDAADKLDVYGSEYVESLQGKVKHNVLDKAFEVSAGGLSSHDNKQVEAKLALMLGNIDGVYLDVEA